ncbi:PREDICTED: uncharacterized protein LOC101299979 isoform X2 [Fragaria vesca subsp. vesca]|uniref:uncharacterized protein LOC101299979 isoform X2 n=1 Tax=Fragaria vesca subsp. vesca TaxID=101020 RepID=UPI0002C3061A|nr:PREDICTED: uncharacterized protein LOC101299979 isoform X2 [Fragaria vesca subsp. vesca]
MVQEVGFDGISMGGNRESGSESSSSACSEQFQDSMHESINSGCHNDEISEAANKRLKETPIQSNEKAQLAQTLLSLPPLGLSLGKTPSFLDLKEKFPRKRKPKRAAEVNVQSMSEKEKLKASNFCASLLRIGSWQRVTEHEGDLVAKCYYAKRKLVWEILDNGLKSKIELQWSDIIAIRAVIEENQPGILEIELGQPPTFHRESNPQPRKHTMWNPATDFTGGAALIHRRHYLQFPPGLLDKHYEKLLQCESRFLEMSQRPFPSQRSPYFQSYNGGADISFEFGSLGAEIPSNLPLQFPTHLDPRQIQAYEETKASLCYTDSTSPVSDEVIGNQGVETQCVPSSWDSQVVAYLLARDQIPQPVSAAEAHFNPAISFQNFNEPIAYNQGSQTLYNIDIEKQLFSHMQIQSYNNSLGSSSAFPENLNSGAITGIEQTNYDQIMSANTNLIPGARDHTGQALPLSWMMAPLPNSWGAPPQVVPSRHSGIHPADNNLRYSSFNPNPTTDDYAAFNNSVNR